MMMNPGLSQEIKRNLNDYFEEKKKATVESVTRQSYCQTLLHEVYEQLKNILHDYEVRLTDTKKVNNWRKIIINRSCNLASPADFFITFQIFVFNDDAEPLIHIPVHASENYEVMVNGKIITDTEATLKTFESEVIYISSYILKQLVSDPRFTFQKNSY